MDVNKIFDLFDDKEPESLGGKTQISNAVFDYKEHPLFWVGMFKKLVHNHNSFNRKIVGFFEKMDEELDLYDVEQAGEFIVFNRAWFWIEKIDTQDRECIKSLLHYTDDYLVTYLKLTIHYFQEFEEYEKCAHLKKILDICEKSYT